MTTRCGYAITQVVQVLVAFTVDAMNVLRWCRHNNSNFTLLPKYNESRE